jgi:L-rhamnose-H+ transport protein
MANVTGCRVQCRNARLAGLVPYRQPAADRWWKTVLRKGEDGMEANPAFGVFLHALGGLAAASFYLPYTRVRNWEWETFWITGGFFAWFVAPLTAAFIIVPDLMGIYRAAPAVNLFWIWFFGVLWGIGGLTFGLSVRYLGQSLGFSISLGFCAAFGTIIPPVFMGGAIELIRETSGLVTLGGVAVCLTGIGVCGLAGMFKEQQLSNEEKTATVRDFSFVKGVWVAVFAGIMSACMAFAFEAGGPLQEITLAHGAPSLFSNLPILVVAFLGGLSTNTAWCIFLNIRKKSYVNYTHSGDAPLLMNYALCALAGTTWYFQFFFYSMGATRMGEYDFSSWTIHMAFIIAISNLWGLLLREWKGTGTNTRLTLAAGIAVLILSTIIVGIGNYLASLPG